MKMIYGLLMVVATTSAIRSPVSKKVTIALGNTFQKVPKAKLKKARNGKAKQWDYTLYVKQLNGEAGAISKVMFYPDIIENTYKPASYLGEKTNNGKMFSTRHDCWGRSLASAHVTLKDGSVHKLKKAIRMREKNDLVFNLEYTESKKKKKPAKKSVKKLHRLMSNRKFGVEVEFVSKLAQKRVLCDAVERATSTPCLDRGYDKKTTKAWKIVPDESISAGFEIASPILSGEKGLRELGDAMDAMESCDGVFVSDACGLHVHIDMTGVEFKMLKRICQNWTKYETGMDSMLEKQRSNEAENEYCLSVRENMKFRELWNDDAVRLIGEAKNVNALAKMMNAHPENRQRHFKLNLQNCASKKRNALEFRAHEGTVDAKAAKNWVRFLVAFVQMSIQSPTPKPFSDNANKKDVFNHLLTHFIPEHNPPLLDHHTDFCNNCWC
eukprot:jgi/Bigna1/91518/estExt_fgenesh1_pg.C_1040012